MTKSPLFYFFTFLILLLFSCEKDEYVCDSGFCRKPYIQMVGQTSAVIKWRTLNPSHGKVKIVSATSSNIPDFTVTETISSKDHEITVTGLNPSTKYYYQIENQDQVLEGSSTMYFTTAPPAESAKPTRVWVIGDAGTGTEVQKDVRDGFLKYNKNQQVDLWLWLGDNAYYSGKDEDYQSNVFSNDYENQMQYMPVYPIPGNHDYAGCGFLSNEAATDNFPYYKIFSFPTKGELGGVPSGSKHYYSIDQSNIHFIFLDSYGCHTDKGSAMYSWLEKDLAKNKQKWTIVSLHHPPYSKGSHDSDNEHELENMRKHIMPLLEQHGTDLVLSGHSHSYERSFLISNHFGNSKTFDNSMKLDGGKGNPAAPYHKTAGASKGTVYIVAGSSGKTTGKQSDWPHPAMAVSDNQNAGSLCIDIAGNKLNSKFLGKKGEVLDEFELIKD